MCALAEEPRRGPGLPGTGRTAAGQGQRVTGPDREDDRDMDDWRKSSYSGSNGGQCIEVASGPSVTVRDTTDRDGVMLTFSAEA
jgi:Domain of unknown function (DUF397)